MTFHHHNILTYKSTIDGHTYHDSHYYWHDDKVDGGNSIVTSSHENNFEWTCVLQQGAKNPYCGYEVLVDHNGQRKGLNLSSVDKIEFEIEYFGDSDWIKLYIKNYDKKYENDQHTKINRLDIKIKRNTTTKVMVDIKQFSVPDWWLVLNCNSEYFTSQTQFNNVTAFEFQTGNNTSFNTLHKFKVKKIILHYKWINNELWYLLIAFVGSLCYVLIFYRKYKKHKKEMEDKVNHYALLNIMQKVYHDQQMSKTTDLINQDSLSKVLNRRGLQTEFETIINNRRAGNLNTKHCLIICDIDKFKNINDTLGHHTGDKVIKTFAHILTQTTRKVDIVGRWGGEEFVVVVQCDNVDNIEQHSKMIAEKIRIAIENYDFGISRTVTASFGVCEIINDGSQTCIDDAVTIADKGLYISKNNGRNLVTFVQKDDDKICGINL